MGLVLHDRIYTRAMFEYVYDRLFAASVFERARVRMSEIATHRSDIMRRQTFATCRRRDVRSAKARDSYMPFFDQQKLLRFVSKFCYIHDT